MLDAGFIRESNSEYASGVVVVEKKGGELRFCVDYRDLNKKTKKDSYPLPRIDDILETLQGSQWFSSLDLASGYWQVEMKPEDIPKTAFITHHGLFEFTVMPFGLTNAPGTFQRLMDKVLRDELWKSVVVYLDDVNIFSKTWEEHLKHLENVFERIKKAGLKLSPKKCQFGNSELKFLGHIVGQDGIKMDPAKIEKVQNFPKPVNVTQVRSFLGLCNYYRKFVKGFARRASPLTELLRKGEEFNWTNRHQRAFEDLREQLTTEPILIYPDWEKPFILSTDASTFAVGAILSQLDKQGNERVIAYASRQLKPAEKNYAATELECLGIIWAIKHFHTYLSGSKFKLITDHAALKYLNNMKEPKGKLARWIMTLQSYNFEVEHRAGKKHQNVDAISRIKSEYWY